MKSRFEMRAIPVLAILILSSGDLTASVIYSFRNSVEFPAGSTFFDKSGTLTPAISDSNLTVFDTNAGIQRTTMLKDWARSAGRRFDSA